MINLYVKFFKVVIFMTRYLMKSYVYKCKSILNYEDKRLYTVVRQKCSCSENNIVRKNN